MRILCLHTAVCMLLFSSAHIFSTATDVLLQLSLSSLLYSHTHYYYILLLTVSSEPVGGHEGSV
jgi:hypothetical protein